MPTRQRSRRSWRKPAPRSDGAVLSEPGFGATTALSFTNSHVQRLRRLLGRRSARVDEQAFVVEGAVLIGEAVAAGWHIEAEFVSADAAAVTTAPCAVLAEGVLKRVASTQHPQPNLAIVRMPTPTALLDDAAARAVLVADRLNDPGNLGTILRSAEAAGIDAVVLTPGSVDPFNPKVVRASAGALFHVPVLSMSLDDVAAAGFRLVGTSSHLGAAYDEADWSGRVAIVLGSEAHGLPADAPVAEWVTIPHRGRSESLNVAMAATLLAFAVGRARAPGDA